MVNDIDDVEMLWNQKSVLIFGVVPQLEEVSTHPGFMPTYQRHRYLIFLNLLVDSSGDMSRSDPSVRVLPSRRSSVDLRASRTDVCVVKVALHIPLVVVFGNL